MYVVTFYSFKGGVGRTMALVNTALQLARNGRRVLIVDFDLEAPGLETFNLAKPRGEAAGLVEYIDSYTKTGSAPDVAEFLYESAGAGAEGGRLWIMPAGRQTETYGQRLASIDWQALYKEHDGFLMFEDMKAQWDQLLDPDYVLIDSRTGHSEVRGICTRQLPDAVVVLFFPNDQNLDGLTKLVRDIKNEEQSANKEIQLHYVTSNVPDIDDPDRILENRLQRFSQQLGFQPPPLTIHHYNNLALLNQVIFTVEKPHSRLAQEYRRLVAAIVRENPEDREGVIDYLRTLTKKSSGGLAERHISAKELERLDTIRDSHPEDGDVLILLAQIRTRQGRHDEALELLSQAISLGFVSPSLLIHRAELYRLRNDRDHALEDINEVLESGDSSYFDASLALTWLRDLDETALASVSDRPAVKVLAFDEQYEIGWQLMTEGPAMKAAEAIFRRLLSDRELTVVQNERAKQALTLCLIGLHRFPEAMALISSSRPSPGDLQRQDAFNYGMAEWAETGTPPLDFFQRVVDLRENDPPSSANYLQCLAIALSLLNQDADAEELVAQADQHIMTRPAREFSAWRYASVSAREFREDLSAIKAMIAGEPKLPRLLQDNTSQDSAGEPN